MSFHFKQEREWIGCVRHPCDHREKWVGRGGVETKKRVCVDGIKAKRYVVAMKIGVAISTRTEMFVLLMTTGTEIGVGAGGR